MQHDDEDTPAYDITQGDAVLKLGSELERA